MTEPPHAPRDPDPPGPAGVEAIVLLVFGSINTDFIFPLARLPAAGDTLWSNGGRSEPGGKGANQAIAAARDGATVELIGAVGRDVLAEGALAGLRRAGVRLRHVARVPAATGRAAIAVDPDGYTQVIADAGANHFARADQVGDDMLGPRTTLLLQMETAAAECAALIARARALDTRIVLNLSPARPIDPDALRAADLLICNSPEMAWLGEHLGTGNNPASIHSALGVAAVRMLGAQGAEAYSDAGFLHMPALAVDMRDTTAAGDCFVGVFAAAIARGAGMATALRRAAVAAALSTTQVGAQATMPARADIDAALREAPQPSAEQREIQD